jgi:predicted GTPase
VDTSKWTMAILAVAVFVTLANAAMLVRQIVAPVHPVYVAKELQKDREFKKAVESIAESVAQSQDYVDESDVNSIVERCRAIVGGRLKCD